MNSKRLRRQTPDEVRALFRPPTRKHWTPLRRLYVCKIKRDGALVGFINRFEEGLSTSSYLTGKSCDQRSRDCCWHSRGSVRTSERIRSFAQAQMNCLSALDCSIPGAVQVIQLRL